MEKDKVMLENFISSWNSEFPDHQLKVSHLKEPHKLFSAVLQILGRLGVDHTVLTESDNNNDSVLYYRDLLPVINMTRILNYLLSMKPELGTSITVSHFLQPTVVSSHSILLLLLNLMNFTEDKLKFIAPHERELFDKIEEVDSLKEQKYKLQELLNQQAEEKGMRAERIEKLDEETRLLEEELKQEADALAEEERQLDAMTQKYQQLDVELEQKRAQLDAVNAEVARKKTLRVYDAEDVHAQLQEANRCVQESEETGNTLKATLAQKEDCLKNLHNVKAHLDTANNLLHEIDKLSDNLAEVECGDLESESKEGEIDVINNELEELQATLRDVEAARQEVRARHAHAETKRQRDITTQQSALQEAIERDRKNKERSLKAVERTTQVKELTLKYEEEKTRGFDEIQTIRNNFRTQLASCEEMAIKSMADLKKSIDRKRENI